MYAQMSYLNYVTISSERKSNMVLFNEIIQDSPMLSPAKKYLTLRAIGAPAVLLSLAMQGVFRGFKDTRTPLFATGN